MKLKLIYQIGGQFKRRAKHYRITPYGLITSLAKVVSEDHRHIVYNKDNIVIRSLLLEFFDEQTIDSFYFLKEFPTRDIEDYLHDCCSIITDVCKNFWTKFESYNIMDILPSDDIIQNYMSYLEGKKVDEHILEVIKEYEKRLMKRLCNNGESTELVRAVDRYNDLVNSGFYNKMVSSSVNCLEEKPPFPLLDIYFKVVSDLSIRLEEKTRSLAFSLVSELGQGVNSLGKGEDEELLWSYNRDLSLIHVFKDKRFIELVNALKKDFDMGYKQLSERPY